jgi:stearoyl-CoA desaturase (Delta-9 desaturase)
MIYYTMCFLVFIAAYLLNMFYISVLYHRALTHGAIRLSPFAHWLVVNTGAWLTGIDPKTWVCMHRLHHTHSDTDRDPHSPWNHGVFGVMFAQLRYYEKVMIKLQTRRSEYTSVVPDLKFPISWVIRKKLWWLPYLVHAGVAVLLGFLFNAWLFGAAYWLGMMSHPIQGWLVNSLAHRFGYRNFNTEDRSKNNSVVAWFVLGEGYQNNHHHDPSSAKFSVRWFEFDVGYLLTRIAEVFGFLEIIKHPKGSTPTDGSSLQKFTTT